MKNEQLLNIVTDNDKLEGAYNIRINGQLQERKTNEYVDIITKKDKSGIDIIVKANTIGQTITIPVIITETDLTDKVYNDFYIGENSDVVIVAGCGIDNCGDCNSQHDGIHTFHLEKNAKVKYIERHYGHGDGTGKKILNPETICYLKYGSNLIMNTTQIEGVDSTLRKTICYAEENSNLVINEKVMTNGNQNAVSQFDLFMNGKNSKAKLTSRVVAKDNSNQEFYSNVVGNNDCFAHIECDAIILNNATSKSVPCIDAKNPDAKLIHEASIGKIAGEQLLKLLTLGLSEQEAEQVIISGFLK